MVNEDTAGIIEYTAARFRRTTADPDDVRQEAWAIALQSKGGVSADVLRKKLGNTVSKWISVTSGNERELEREHRVDIRVSTEDYVVATTDETPESRYLSYEAQVTSAAWRSGVVDAVRAWAGERWEIVRRFYGLDGCEKQGAEAIAEALQVPRRKVFYVSNKLRQWIRDSPEIAALWSRRDEIAEET